ncbi:MAG TPA: S1C family serine protease [Phenylobacterium sp.]|nr:S1C family serine protease [Phenylobacterium sp.]
MIRLSMIAACAAVALANVANAEEIQSPPGRSLPLGARTLPVNLSRVLIDIPVGQRIGIQQGGLFCIPMEVLKWRSGRFDVADAAFPDVFRRAMRAAGFQSGTDNLFDPSADNAGEFAVGARVKSIDAKICSSQYDDTRLWQKGSATLAVEWQVYSRLQQRVVATISTTGFFELRRAEPDNVVPILLGAFERNATALTEDAEFKKLFVRPANDAEGPQKIVASADPIVLNAAPKTTGPISEASGSVVAIFAGDGFGSGFLVSSDGYVLTNAHVVGAERKVRVRWSDGFESEGEVLRNAKARDVALIRTNPHGRQPFPLHRGAATPGAAVFAIGTPLDAKFQGTLTKGIVSANRIFDGYSYIQSDVLVNHGNSGGPLLDEKGAVIGITVKGYDIGGAPAGLNLFIPIGDALDFLNLKPAT